MNTKLRVTIIGAGLGGLVAAIASKRAGFEVRGFEQAKAFGEVGAGIQLGPNAVKVLRALDLEQGLFEFGAQPRNHVARSWKSGRELFRSPTRDACVEQFGSPFFQVQRSDLHQHLHGALPDDTFLLNKKMTGFTQSENSVVARFDDGTEVESDVLVGADGIHSTVRNELLGAGKPRYTGVICWRGQVDASRLPSDLIPPDSLNWMGPGGCVVHYFVRPGRLVNWIAHRQVDVWADESWSRPGDKNELLEAFTGWHPSLLQMFEATETCFKWALFDRDPLPTWTKGRVTLLGDSAHPMLPFFAQGGAMAMEDGYVLARALARNPDPIAGLQAYEALRKERSTRVQLSSRARADSIQTTSRLAQVKRDIGFKVDQWLRPAGAIRRADWIYGYDATAVSA
ncbi:6-hydroxynicotinate 3-monooxygenase precursor [Pigmentiphaga humi]|uniref:6-hydroxynicotinate 3-monooxygenase n=1 Tax=Pigmentiphaga humi TaxID=2478468 RepID=A0A3P4B4K5_9BURK|nr:FAD-dependent monooxygenase [Pigmentiphaga humi]VCU70992.1 6-hydroxynicotinate 3-monooxygenase precursor [Pigmentiphaga humi]